MFYTLVKSKKKYFLHSNIFFIFRIAARSWMFVYEYKGQSATNLSRRLALRVNTPAPLPLPACATAV
jgi:hypothetical protein